MVLNRYGFRIVEKLRTNHVFEDEPGDFNSMDVELPIQIEPIDDCMDMSRMIKRDPMRVQEPFAIFCPFCGLKFSDPPLPSPEPCQEISGKIIDMLEEMKERARLNPS